MLGTKNRLSINTLETALCQHLPGGKEEYESVIPEATTVDAFGLKIYRNARDAVKDGSCVKGVFH